MTDNQPPAPPAPVPEDSGFSEEQLEIAKKDIENMQPDVYIQMIDYIKMLEGEQEKREDAEGDRVVLKYGRKDGFSEAGGVVWGVIKTEAGSEITIVTRNTEGIDAFDEFYDTVKYAIGKVGGHLIGIKSSTPVGKLSPPAIKQTPPPVVQQPQPVVQPQPQMSSVQQAPTGQPVEGGIEVFPVKSVAHNVSKTGIDVLQVKGGKYSKFGHTAWPEHVPPTVQYTNWPIGEEYTPPDEMKYAWLDTSTNRFVAFAVEAQ